MTGETEVLTMPPEMIFLLASPRSGSTLLRAMLAGHPDLFSPPELNLLPFYSMRERELALGALANDTMPCDQRVGLVEAVMHLKGEDAEGVASWLCELSYRDVSTCQMYGSLREMAAPRRLVDKSTLNCSCIDFLQRSRWLSPSAHYIHLVRHPYSVIESLQRMYFAHAALWEGFRSAEALWTVTNRNVLCFLQALPACQNHFVRFEELVADPEKIMRGICAFLDLRFDEALLKPYEGGRMIDGSPGDFVSLGDPNFKNHSNIDANLGDVWRSLELPCELSWDSRWLSTRLGYELPQRHAEHGPAQRKSDDIILVIPPLTYRADAYIAAARQMGLQPVCALDPAYGIPDSIEAYLPISFEFPECAAQALVGHAMSRPVAGILSVDDGGAEVAAIASGALGLPHNPIEAHHATRNKYAMRLLFQRAGLPSPEFSVHMLCEDPHRIAERLRYPVVLKPLYLTGSRGVIRANSPDEFVPAFARVAALLAQPGTGPDPKCLLVERYIPGAEVSVDGVLHDGALRTLAIYDKPDPMEGPFFEETIFTTPSRHPQDVQEQIVLCAESAAKAIGLRMGAVHVELRVNQDGPWLLEVAARTMGGYCSRALPFESGRALEELVLTQVLSRSIDEFVPASGSHGVMMVPIPGEGIYRGVAGTTEAEATPGVTGLMITITPGNVVTPLPEGDKYIGFIFAHGECPTLVEKALREAHKCLSFDLDPIARPVLETAFR